MHDSFFAADFIDVYPGAYIPHTMKESMSMEEKISHQPCSSLSSSYQFRAPTILWADIDQYLNIQAQGQNDCNKTVTLRCNEVNMGLPTFIAIIPNLTNT